MKKSMMIIITMLHIVFIGCILIVVVNYVRETEDFNKNKDVIIAKAERQVLALQAWENTIEKLNYDADVVFFGDSLTCYGNFNDYFSDVKTVNLGYAGETIPEMIERAHMVGDVTPEKVFVLGGFNSLHEISVEEAVTLYGQMLDQIHAAAPNSKIYVQSMLPIGKNIESGTFTNKKVQKYNLQLKKMAEDRNMVYIDLCPLYEKDGVLNPDLTEDGVHLKPEAYSLWADQIKEYVHE